MKRTEKNKILIALSISIVLVNLLFGVNFLVLGKDMPLELSLSNVTNLALENSLDIQIAKFDAYISKTSLLKTESIFDTFLEIEASYDRDKKAQTSTILGNLTKEHGLSVGLEKKLPTGTTISLDANGKKNRSDSVFSTLNPYNESLLELSVTQELGKNFFGLADRSDIKITKIDIENSSFTSLDSIETVLADVQEAYWNFALKDTELFIKKDMLNEAEKLYETYKDKFDLGLVEESELLAVEALVYTRRSDVAIADLNRETAKNALLFLVNKGDFEEKIIPTDNLACPIEAVDLYTALSEAVEYRRDYKRIKNDLRKNKINIVVKKNALWPQIDLEASLIRNNLNSDRRQAWEDIATDSNDEISLLLRFKVPLENRAAKSELEKVKLENGRSILLLKRTERLILQEINDKVKEVNTAKKKVRLFKKIVQLHRKKLAEAVKRFNFGRSDSDTLIRYEEDLLQARLSLAAALFDYRVGLIGLETAKNTLLDKYWVDEL